MKISSIQTSEELQFKVLVVGEYGVGKTAVIRRYTEGQFSLNYKVTIGVDFAVKTFEWDSKTKLNIQLWDIAGHERFGTLTRVYYKYAVAAVIVFDLSRPESLQSVVKWVIDIREKTVLMDGKKIPVILLANKCDVEGITINTDAAMEWIVTRILEQRAAPPSPLKSIKLDSEDSIPDVSSSSCCR
ncbi:Ras-related protein Rab-32B [Armadillidium nasatum]|uniref:Ras-related protein Rab-32B n=1 Tax=Armadillidium nasatum TaxID=96803 RepID=A0A5N5T1F6_9CRUS|nr:Ras-related protein Rab-32B [Armadillidium nasatum]